MLNANLARQFDLLRSIVSVSSVIGDFRITISMVKALHAAATTFLVDHPGQYRDEAVRIIGSEHSPPDHGKIEFLMTDMIRVINEGWTRTPAPALAAYALWRLSWVHPFVDGNGRCARALAYLILCRKYGRWLPGERTIIMLIKQNPERYRQCLADADSAQEEGRVNLTPLATLIAELLALQLEDHNAAAASSLDA